VVADRARFRSNAGMHTRRWFSLTLLLGLRVFSTPAHAQDTVGINAHLAPDDVYDLAADLGVGFVRIDNNWLSHEPADGRYDWGELDRAVNRIVGHGQSVYMTIGYTPAWAAAPGQPNTQGAVPRPGLYARYVRAVVERYRDRVRHYGLWNEPNLPQFWSGTAAEYADEIATPGAAAIHDACPGCFAVGPDLAGLGGWQLYMEQVFQRAGAAFDIISHHTYAKPVPLHGGWICDDFDHALDNSADPICFYKPGLRQVLNEFDTTRGKQVWLTETGYQAQPFDSPDERRRQADFVDAVLDRQLRTPWWTQTHFYELVDCRPIQPDCDIDGFGITRRRNGPDADFADNFLLQPAYVGLRARIAGEPLLRGEGIAPPPPPPPARTLNARPHGDTAPDADLADFADESCVVLPDYVALTSPRADANDLWTMACAGWSRDALWLGFDTIDSVHESVPMGAPDEALWQGDSVQIGVDVLDDGGAGYGADDAEITVARVGGETRVHVSPGVLPTTAATARMDDHTFTEVRIGLPGRAAGQRLHVSFLVNDADGAGREGWLEFTPGIGREKRPADFGYIALLPPEGEPPPPPPDAGSGMVERDASGPSPTADAMFAPDAGRSPDAAFAPDVGEFADARAPMLGPDAQPGTPTSGAASTGTSSGCGISGRPRGAAWAAFAVALLALVGARRRRA
jgi:hypothetical protein